MSVCRLHYTEKTIVLLPELSAVVPHIEVWNNFVADERERVAKLLQRQHEREKVGKLGGVASQPREGKDPIAPLEPLERSTAKAEPATHDSSDTAHGGERKAREVAHGDEARKRPRSGESAALR